MNPHPPAPKDAARGPLAGIGVIVTRPARQAAGFAHKLATLDASPIVFPAIVILPPEERAPLERAHATLASYDFAVFVSANAIEYGVPARWPRHVIALAPGPGTAEALADVGVTGVRIPGTTFDSEGLLALPELKQVAGKRVVIFRGDGGRELLGESLAARGAHVDHVACYRRAAPQSGAAGLVDALREGRAHALTLTSSEGLDNLWAVVGEEGRALLARIATFAPHPRIAQRALELRLDPIETGPGDAGLISGLLEWATRRSHRPHHG